MLAAACLPDRSRPAQLGCRRPKMSGELFYVRQSLQRAGHVRSLGLAECADCLAQQLARTGRHSTSGPLTAAEIIHHKAWHDLLHVQQICRMLAIPLDAGSGAMRQFH